MLWRVRLLGGLALERDGAAPITHFRSRKTAALFAYLVLHPGQHSRERLIDLFWPDDPPPQAQQSLRAALASLRRQLEPPEFPSVMIATRTHAGLHPGAFSTDLGELEAALAAKDARKVRELAVGPLLPDIYDDWAVTAAEGLQARLDRFVGREFPATGVTPSIGSPYKRLGVPPSLDRFFGRERERQHVHQLLLDGTPVTLIGAGGSGKTRLAVECALTWEGASVFLALADVTDPQDVEERLARLLEAKPTEIKATLERERSPLLVLDNAEQLVGTVLKAFILSLRAALPGLRLLITSRQRVGFTGERLSEVTALPLPNADAELARLAGVPSMALLVDRAQTVRGDFQLTLRNAGALAELVQTLEGIPLAIELAASWIGVLTPLQLTERVRQSRLSLPSRRTRGGRHHSLWAVAHSSYALLSGDLQRLFQQLSVFRGGATLEAIAAVAGQATVEESVLRLSERSLVRLSPTDPPRFSLPEALREFAAERLAEQQEENETRRRHVAHFTDYAEALERELATDRQAMALAAADREFDNFSAAIAVADAGQALRLSSALWRFWESRGRLREAEAALTDALGRPGADDPALDEYRARALGGLGIALLRRRDLAGARQKQEAALAIRRAQGEPVGIAIALYNVGSAASASGDFDTAASLFEQAIVLLRPFDDLHRLSTMLTARGNLEVRRKQPLLGLPYLEEACAIQRASGNTMGLIYTLLALAALRYELGELDEEIRLYEEALPLCVAIRDVVNGATAILNMADSLSEQNAAPERIVYLAALGESARRKHGIPLLPSDAERRARLAPLLQQPRYEALWAQAESADWTAWDTEVS